MNWKTLIKIILQFGSLTQILYRLAMLLVMVVAIIWFIFSPSLQIFLVFLFALALYLPSYYRGRKKGKELEDSVSEWLPDILDTVSKDNQMSLEQRNALSQLSNSAKNISSIKDLDDIMLKEPMMRIQLGLEDAEIEKTIKKNHHLMLEKTHRDDPDNWTHTSVALANLYMERVQGKRSENLEKAIEYYEKALDVVIRENKPQDWATIIYRLALAYSARIIGDRYENQDLSIKYFKQALQVKTYRDTPKSWIAIMQGLADIYSRRVRGVRKENLQQALEYYELILKECSQDMAPLSWAQTHKGIAVIYSQLLGKERKERENNLEKAIHHIEQALTFYTEKQHPKDWGDIHNILGSIYAQRITGSQKKNLELAIGYFQKALRVRAKSRYLQDWAGTQFNIGMAYHYYIRHCADDEKNKIFDLALIHYQKALNFYQDQANTILCIKTARSIGDIGLQTKKWDLAIHGYSEALEAHHKRFFSAFTRTSKQTELEDIQDITLKISYAYVQTGQLEKSIETIEEGRNQLMRDVIDRKDYKLRHLKELGFATLHESYTQAYKKYEDFVISASNEYDASQRWYNRAEDLRKEVENIERTVREVAGKEYPEFRYFMQPLPFSEIQTLSKDAALVYILSTPHGGAGLIISKGEIQAVPIDQLSDAFIMIGLLQYGGNEIIGGYFATQIGIGDHLSLATELDKLLPAIGSVICKPLASALRELDIRNVILIPAGRISLLPLHAAPYVIGGETSMLMDEFTVSYAPSAHSISHSKKLVKSLVIDDVPELLGIGNPMPLPGENEPLLFSKMEVDIIGHFFSRKQVLVEEKATKENVKKNLCDAQYLHFACHGNFDFLEPLRSGLVLSHGEKLTIQNLLDQERPLKARLAFLSACQTAIAEHLKVPNETIGLPTAFHQNGVPGVIGTLWTVSDLSTALLVTRFYLYHLLGDPDAEEIPLNPPVALKRAQIWLKNTTNKEIKSYITSIALESSNVSPSDESIAYILLSLDDNDETPFSHPLYWAGFSYTGI